MAEKQDDFETAFAQFSVPEDTKSKSSASAAPADEKVEEGTAKGGDDAGSGDDAGAGAVDGGGVGGDGGAGAVEGVAGDDKGAEGDDAAAAAGAAEPGEGEGDKAPEGEEGKAVEGAADVGAEKGEGPSADDILAGLKDLIAQGKSEVVEGDDKGEKKDEPETPIYSDDEQTFLTEYDKEWGDVARGESLKRRAEYRELVGYVFQQVMEYVKPIKEMAEAVAERTHRQDIETNISDYSDNLRDDVVSWVKTQPAYLQPAYNHVITQGTVEEVKDLVDRYRAATGKRPAGSGNSQKQTGKKDNELSDEAKKAAASLAPVESKRSGVQQPGDPSNFDDAWKQFTADET